MIYSENPPGVELDSISQYGKVSLVFSIELAPLELRADEQIRRLNVNSTIEEQNEQNSTMSFDELIPYIQEKKVKIEGEE